MSERLSPERAARLLRAKSAELEGMVREESAEAGEWALSPWLMLAADIALVAQLLADEIERNRCTCPRIRVGMKVTENRNLSPDCPVHGEQARDAEDQLFGRDR